MSSNFDFPNPKHFRFQKVWVGEVGFKEIYLLDGGLFLLVLMILSVIFVIKLEVLDGIVSYGVKRIFIVLGRREQIFWIVLSS